MSWGSGASVEELAAFLGVSRSRIHKVIRDHDIKPTGQRWKAYLYDGVEVARHAGAHDRLSPADDGV